MILTKCNLRAIELIKENEKLKQEIQNLKYKVLFLSIKAIEEQQEVEAELEDFKNKYLNLLMEMQNKEQEKQELKIALRKCSPWLLTTNQCLICGGKNNHLDDCEYVRLCATDINVGIKKEE